ncbi:alpha-L-fucosidase [bacterium]|nr:alpha-L-fucosidase [bacterium]
MSDYLPTAVPTARQLEYQDWEMGLFLHFGIRTFYEGHRDWDGKPMFSKAFVPSALDPEDWVLSAKNAGMKYLVLTAKHHDGFANWPSEYTEFHCGNSPWRNGEGNVVRDFIAACRKHDMHPGLYYSPAQWGGTVDFRGDAKAYDDYFINQISEILEPYGPIDVLWFDGCGSADHEYDWQRITDHIRKLQPEVNIFSMGTDPNFTWVGNEAGIAPVPNWNTRVADQGAPIDGQQPVKWLPAECDCMMRFSNWFYSDQDEHTVKSVEQLMGLYYYSVGRGCNLLINIGPDRRGLLPDKDRARLLQFGEEIRRRFGRPLATLDAFTREGDTWTYASPEPFLVDHVITQEDLTRGEHVRRFVVEAVLTHGGPAGTICLWEGQNLGHKQICPFSQLQVRQIRLRVTESDGPVSLRALELHKTR